VFGTLMQGIDRCSGIFLFCIFSFFFSCMHMCFH
jgi:hypothetical protein